MPSREGAQSAYPAAEDGEAAEADPLRLPDSLIPQQISVNEFRKEQLKDEFAKQLLEKLAHADVVTRAEGTAPRSGAVLRLAKFAALDGVLHRVTDASDPKEGYDSARIYVPPSLRQRLIRLKHATVFGAHRNERATHQEIIAMYWWPGLEQDVHKFVKNCVHCELAKGTKPSRQGFLQGWKHSAVMNMITMDLIGPIGGRDSALRARALKSFSPARATSAVKSRDNHTN